MADVVRLQLEAMAKMDREVEKRPYSALGYRPLAPEAIILMDQTPTMY
jgi:hypothetical protein